MDLERIREIVEKDFSSKNDAREKGLVHSRKAIQYCGNAIRSIHRGEVEKSRELVSKARQEITDAIEELKDFPDIYHAGFMQNAEKEYVEAETTLALIVGDDFPKPQDLGVGYAQYLNGLGEAIGEMRRHILDLIRKSEHEKADKLLSMADDIFYLMASFDYPDAITYGLRRTQDMTRAIMERTRGDLTTAITQKSLQKSLVEMQARLDK